MSNAIVPIAKVPISIRVATVADIPFIDALMKTQRRALGYWSFKQIEGHVRPGYVLIAEEMRNGECGMRNEFSVQHSSFSTSSPLGYLISRDRYLKRDELGVIYQMNVVPGAQRKCVAASLLREAFSKSAYGCRLYCCWCAQDLVAANEFWEAMGFVPVAFRAGSDRKKRVHIFWQKRICEGDVETKWWYPFKTDSGAIRADRVVFPIPTGVNWRDVRAVEVPVVREERSEISDLRIADARVKTLPTPKSQIQNPKSTNVPGPGKVGILVGGRLKYVTRPGYTEPPAVAGLLAPEPVERVKPKREKKPAEKIDPAFLAKARELRDRWLECVNAGEMLLEGAGKYHIARALPEMPERPTLLLSAA